MNNKLNVAMIGCGAIANSKHMPALSKLETVRLVAFYDVIKDKATKALEQYGSEHAKVYEDYRELLADQTIDVVHVCTPNHSHAEISIAALEAGKHVMCEKPMAIDTEDAKKMLEAAKRTGKKLTIGYNNRFRPDSQHLKKLCDRGDLGEIYFAKANAIRRRAVPSWGVFLDKELQGGGPLIDIGTHALDLTLWLMNNYKPKVVLGSAFQKLGKKKSDANMWGAWDPNKFGVEDSAFGFIKMENGATIILESSWALNTLHVEEATCELSGTEAGVDMVDGLRINGESFGSLYTTKIETKSHERPTDLEIRTWIECILNDSEPVVKAEEALVVTQILEAIYKSSETGEAVYF